MFENRESGRLGVPVWILNAGVDFVFENEQIFYANGFQNHIRAYFRVNRFRQDVLKRYLTVNHTLHSLLTPDKITQLLRDRNEQGMEALYDQYAANLYGIIARMLPDKIAEEALQKTMLKIWNGIDTYDSAVASLYTWMSTIARNTAVDYRRLKSFQNTEKTISLDHVVYRESASSVTGAHIDVQSLLEGIDEKFRIVLEYAYLKGYTHKEIAEALDMPMGTVKTRLRGAILALREKLKNEKHLFRDGIGMLLTMIMSGV